MSSTILSAWVSSNVEGSYKRSAVLGMAIGWGNLNGAVTSNVVRLQIVAFFCATEPFPCLQTSTEQSTSPGTNSGMGLSSHISPSVGYVLWPITRTSGMRMRGETEGIETMS